ncbi:MAG: hypothetical protein HZA78_01285 [Candidatus Schekmanbacteria bacterium]|nr:hypothetical protein [Candidatus Schekmanbacteria bacterium]
MISVPQELQQALQRALQLLDVLPVDLLQQDVLPGLPLPELLGLPGLLHEFHE